eukprot:Platyproteum_vivax@DN2068_c0_g1_i1.p1
MADRYLIRKVTLPEGVKPMENLAKKMERDNKLEQEKNAAVIQKRRELAALKTKYNNRAYQYRKEYQQAEQQIIDLRRAAKESGGFYKEAEHKVIFCIRIKGVNKLAPKPKKVLQLFRLLQLHNGVFIKVNKATLHMLQIIQPFVTFGYPSLGAVRNLLYKRGYGKVNKQRIRIDDNEIIRGELGKHGIECMEDLVHEIYTCGSHFKEAANFLWPFKLKPPTGGFVCKRHGFNEARPGDWGNREELISELINRMV